MKEQSFITGVLFMLASATGLAFTGLLGKLGMEVLSLTSLIFLRYVSSFLLCFLFLWVFGQLKGGFSVGNIKMHMLRASFSLCAQYSFYYYIERNTLLNAIVLLNMGPLIIPIIEWGILRNKVGKSTWVGVAVSFIGVVCVIQPDEGIFSLVSFIGLLAGICQGASQVVFGINSRSEKSGLSVLYLFFFCAAFSMIPYLCLNVFWPGESAVTSSSQHSFLWLLIIGLAAASLCNQLTRASAYQHSTPSRLAPFLYLSVLLAGVLDWLIFAKIPNTLSIVGASLVVLGGILKIYMRARTLRKTS